MVPILRGHVLAAVLKSAEEPDQTLGKVQSQNQKNKIRPVLLFEAANLKGFAVAASRLMKTGL